MFKTVFANPKEFEKIYQKKSLAAKYFEIDHIPCGALARYKMDIKPFWVGIIRSGGSATNYHMKLSVDCIAEGEEILIPTCEIAIYAHRFSSARRIYNLYIKEENKIIKQFLERTNALDDPFGRPLIQSILPIRQDICIMYDEIRKKYVCFREVGIALAKYEPQEVITRKYI